MATKGNIHRKLLYRLAPAAVALSVVLGLGVYFIELEKVDETLVDLAMAESRSFMDSTLDRLPPRTAEDRAVLEETLSALVARRREAEGGHFVFAELYGSDRGKIAEFIEPQHEYVEKAMDRGGHIFPGRGQPVWYRKLGIGGDLFLQAVVSLHGPEGKLIGFFEGVYQVTPEKIAEIREATAGSVILAVTVVLLTTAILYPLVLRLHRDVLARSRALLQANVNTLEVLGDAIAKRDSDTSAHNYRVTAFAVRLAEAMGLDDGDIRALIKGAFLHDVGKIAISDAILLKPGRLTEDEFEIMKTHVEHGLDIVRRSGWLDDAAAVVRHHHEKVDGSGYPDGLAGDAIPATARIFAIADVFDALTSKRPYKDAMPVDKAVAILVEGRAKHFDPEYLDAFTKMAAGLHATYAEREEAALEDELRNLTARYFGDTAV